MLDQPVVGGRSCRVCKILQVEFNVTRDRNHGCEKTLWIFHIFNPPRNAWWRRTRGMGKCPLSKIPISLLASQVLRFTVFLWTSISSHCFGTKIRNEVPRVLMKYEIHLIIQKLQPLQIDPNWIWSHHLGEKILMSFPRFWTFIQLGWHQIKHFLDNMPRLFQKGFFSKAA